MMPNIVSTSKEKRKEERSFIAKKEEINNVDGKPQRFLWLQYGKLREDGNATTHVFQQRIDAEGRNFEFSPSTLYLRAKNKRKLKRNGLHVDGFDDAVVRKTVCRTAKRSPKAGDVEAN